MSHRANGTRANGNRADVVASQIIAKVNKYDEKL